MWNWFYRRWAKREDVQLDTLSEWIKSIGHVLQCKRSIRRLKHTINTRHASILSDPDVVTELSRLHEKQKQKYRGMFVTQKSGNKTRSGDIGLNIKTLASPKVGQDQVSGGVSVLCWHAATVANVLWKPLTASKKFKFDNKAQISNSQKLV